MSNDSITLRRVSGYLTFHGIAVGLLFVALLWVFWPTLGVLADRWGSDPRYSHGYLVPLFSVYLLWSRRQMMDETACRPTWFGILFLAAGLLLRVGGDYWYYEWAEALALLPCLAGATLLAGGWTALRWSWPAIAFLVFMVPLPFRVETYLAHPLQRLATVVSTYLLQTLGFMAMSEGNTIRMGDVRLDVAEACSGLSMLIMFVALSTAVAIVLRRPLYERLIVLASSVPIALVANITRISLTGIVKKIVSDSAGEFIHDYAGYWMPLLALGIMWLELRLLHWLIRDVPSREKTLYHPVLGRRTTPSMSASRSS